MTAVGAQRGAARQPDAGPVAGASGGAGGRPDERPDEQPGERVPGEGRFALLGETLLTGLLVLAGSLFVVTLPAALAAGVAHLRRYVAGYDTSAHSFARDWRAAVRETWLLGVLALAAGAVVLVNTGLTASGVLPGAPVVRWVTWAAAACAAVVLVRAAAAWSDGEGATARPAETDRGPVGGRDAPRSARALLARGAARAGDDLVGSALLLAALGLCAVLVWMLLPLVLVTGGLLSLAATAVETRRTGRPSLP
ncbi:hypothetical protein GCM10010102_00450 [Promicromonospora citrea]|uniref:Poxvirus protein I5 n=1 Tax=Promicromonospora citrea TaxID=43677 RepID=A0A8H9L0B9_9MICO|nr:hypothetical protein GCM10010102_00450 [Promicromonospora citrea]